MLHEKNIDVLILGGGLTGLITAYLMLENNISIGVLDKNKLSQQSLPSDYEINTDLSLLSKRVGQQEVYDVFKLSIDALYRLDEMTSKLGIDCDYKREPQMIENPTLQEKNTSYQIYPQLLVYNSGARINLDKLYKGLYKYLKNRCLIVENKKLYEIDINHQSIQVILEDKEIMKCKKIIVASGVDGFQYFDKPYSLKKKQNIEYKYHLIKEKKVEYLFSNNELVENDKIAYVTSDEEYPNVDYNIDLSQNGLIYSLMGALIITNKYCGNDFKEFNILK